MIPKQGEVVFLGGAEGLVVGGTGKYRNATGPYLDAPEGGDDRRIVCVYDELFFRFREVEIQ